MKNRYDYLLVGAGLFNAIFAKEASLYGKRCLVVEKRSHIGGNLFCEEIEGINVHIYGPHIFHTSDRFVWEYMRSLCDFNHFVYTPIANYKGEIYNLPFNMNTFYQLWGTKTPEEALSKIESQRLQIPHPENLEEQALSLVGTDIYHKLIKGYTEKQWGKDSKDLPAFIIQRLPCRFTYNNNYYNDIYQGIPIGGYNPIFEKCFAKADVLTNTDFLSHRELTNKAKVTIYTGAIDRYFDYCFGQLEYRSLRFEMETLKIENYQGNAAVNYTDRETPYTRIIESKHFEFGKQPNTVITKEYPISWEDGSEPFYPVNTTESNKRYEQYKKKARQSKDVYFAGRLGAYKYYNMDGIIQEAIKLYNHIKHLSL
jgi:UDP-galactopyranose mutase